MGCKNSTVDATGKNEIVRNDNRQTCINVKLSQGKNIFVVFVDVEGSTGNLINDKFYNLLQ